LTLQHREIPRCHGTVRGLTKFAYAWIAGREPDDNGALYLKPKLDFIVMDWDHAIPLAGFAGGLLIGIAGAVMLLGLGRIAGVSGLAARAAGLSPGATPWPLAAAFIVGLPLGAALIALAAGPVVTRFAPSLAIVAVGGLAVGFGTRLGSGCTSGHGVCGLSRLSPRSLAATAAFTAAGFATVAVMRALGMSW